MIEHQGDDAVLQGAYTNLGLTYGYLLGQWEEALPYHQEAVRIATRCGYVMSQAWSNKELATAYLMLNQLDAADDHAQASFSAFKRLGHREAKLGLCLQVVIRQRQGKVEEAEALLEQARAVPGVLPGDPYIYLTWLFTITGDLDQALDWLGRGRPFFDEQHLEEVRTSPHLQPLRDHPRFRALMGEPAQG